MKSLTFTIAFCCLIHLSKAQIIYTKTNTVDSVDKFYGVTYPDNYRWLENLKEDSVAKWYKEQSNLTLEVISKIKGRNELLTLWKELDKIKQTRYFDIYKRKDRTFYKKRIPGEAAKLYFKDDKDGKEELLFDPTTYSSDKTISLQAAIPNLDGSKIVVAFAIGGAEISTLKILDLETKTPKDEEIFPCSANNIFWCADNKSFIYTFLKTADNASQAFLKNNTVKIHRIGDNVKNDNVYFSNEAYPELKLKPENFVNGELNRLAPKFLFTSIINDDGLNIYYYSKISDLYSKHITWMPLCKANDKLVKGIDFLGDKVFAITNKNAPNYKLIATSIERPDWNNPEIVAAERKDLFIDGFTFTKDFILITYTDGINKRLFKYNIKSKKTSEINLPFRGTIFVENYDKETNICYVNITSWNKPFTEFKLDAKTDVFSPSDFNLTNNFPKEYLETEVQEVEVKGHDGIMIPLSIIYKKGLKKDSSNICLIEGYGSYGWSMQPTFNNYWLSLVNKGVVIAVAHVRGGGEKGDTWQNEGFKTTKPNTWKDFNSCAQFLVSNGFTSAKKIIGSSASAGGILVSRAMTERPDLYGAIISNSGILNTIRLEKMPNGPNLAFQFGTTKDSVECKALYEMDGLLHINRNVQYPAVICVSGWNDPRVSSWQSGKFIAALQNLNKKNKLALLKINYDSGHFNRLEDLADNWAFALWQCGHPEFKLE